MSVPTRLIFFQKIDRYLDFYIFVKSTYFKIREVTTDIAIQSN